MALERLKIEEKLKHDALMEAEYRRRFLFYKPHSKQRIFHAAGKYAQERLITGGNRTGKTYGALIEVSKHLTGEYGDDWDGYRFDHPITVWIAGKTAPVIAETIQKDLIGDADQGIEGILHPSYIVSKRRSGNSDMYRTIYVKHKSGGTSKAIFKSFVEGREAYQGAKIHLVQFDEEPPFDIYQEAKMRTMKTSEGFHGMLIVSSTPLKGYTDFFNYFMDDRHPEEVQDSIWHAHITWQDAVHLPEAEKKRLLAGMSPHEIEARTKGVPWPGSGLVYPVPEDMITCIPFEIPRNWSRFFGIDFGWTHPTALVFFAHDRDNDVIYAYAEYSVSERTPEKHAHALQSYGINWIPGVYDPAGRNSQQADGKTLVGLYREAGMTNLQEANNSREEGILKVLQRMQAGQLKIFTTLVKTLGEFRKYARDEDGIPKKINDDLMDALRYGVVSGPSKGKPENFRDSNYYGMYSNAGQAGYI